MVRLRYHPSANAGGETRGLARRALVLGLTLMVRLSVWMMSVKPDDEPGFRASFGVPSQVALLRLAPSEVVRVNAAAGYRDEMIRKTSGLVHLTRVDGLVIFRKHLHMLPVGRSRSPFRSGNQITQ